MIYLNWIGQHPFLFVICLWSVLLSIESCVGKIFQKKVTFEEIMEEEDEAS